MQAAPKSSFSLIMHYGLTVLLYGQAYQGKLIIPLGPGFWVDVISRQGFIKGNRRFKIISILPALLKVNRIITVQCFAGKNPFILTISSIVSLVLFHRKFFDSI